MAPDSGHAAHPPVRGQLTLNEIFGQPALWQDTLTRMQGQAWPRLAGERGVICGAGSSAYASAAVQVAWPHSRAVPTTDLLIDSNRLAGATFMLSLARSGDSPESSAVIELARKRFPDVKQFAITCNPAGKLARLPEVMVAQLDPRTNDQSLVMTSSFSNLVLAGLSLTNSHALRTRMGVICDRVRTKLPSLVAVAEEIAKDCPSRAAVLASPPLFPWAQEASLKILEMTAGKVPTLAETYLGLRHGPMSFIDRQTLVLCLISGDPYRRPYELDLIAELRSKQIGRIITITDEAFATNDIGLQVDSLSAELPDHLRTPFEIVFPQLLAYHCSLQLGLNPDSPSPDGIITRVVPDIPIH